MREGGRQLCPRPAVPSSVIAAGGWPWASVWKHWGDRGWEEGDCHWGLGGQELAFHCGNDGFPRS